MKTYTEKEVNRQIHEALTICKIQDAAAVSMWAGSTRDAAEMILKGANITKAEVRKHLSDKGDRRRLCAILG